MPYTPPWLDINPAQAVFQAAGIAASAGEREKELNQQKMQEGVQTLMQVRNMQERHREATASEALQRDELTMRAKQLDATREAKEAAAQQLMEFRTQMLNYQQDRLTETEKAAAEKGDLQKELEKEKEAAAQALADSKKKNFGFINSPAGIFKTDPDTGEATLLPGTGRPDTKLTAAQQLQKDAYDHWSTIYAGAVKSGDEDAASAALGKVREFGKKLGYEDGDTPSTVTPGAPGTDLSTRAMVPLEAGGAAARALQPAGKMPALPVAGQYQTPDQVKLALKSGAIDRVTAMKILQSQFGMQ